MEDQRVLETINRLVDEEHQLWERSHGGEALTPEEEKRLRALEVTIDQCWDLLRQRRARREFGFDPDDSDARDAGTVEGYRQ